MSENHFTLGLQGAKACSQVFREWAAVEHAPFQSSFARISHRSAEGNRLAGQTSATAVSDGQDVSRVKYSARAARSGQLTSNRKSDRCAFTLMEVVLGLVLMATVLVSSLMALSKHRRQLADAETRIVAAQAADEILMLLTTQRDGIPLAGRGAVEGHKDWYWKTTVVGLAEPMRVPVRVIRFEIRSASDTRDRALVSVELVKPVRAADTFQTEDLQASNRFPAGGMP